MRRRFLSSLAVSGALAFATLGVLSTLPADAQTEPADAPALVIESLVRAGLSEITHVRRRGDNFTANAIKDGRHPARVVVDGRSGRIVGFRLIETPPPPPAQD